MPINPVQDLGGFGRLAEIVMQRRQMEQDQANRLAAQDLAQRQLDEAIASRAFNQDLANRNFAASEAEREANRLWRERQMSWKNDELLREEEERQRKEALGRSVGNALAFQGPLPGGAQMDRDFMLSNVAGAVSGVKGASLADILEAQKAVETQYPDMSKLASSLPYSPGTSQVVLDENNVPSFVVPITDKGKGTTTAQIVPIGGAYKLPGDKGLTYGQKINEDIRGAGGKAGAEAAVKADTEPGIQQNIEARKLAAKKSEEYFGKVSVVREANNLIREAIAAIDSGAWTGPVANFLPSLRESSVKLQNVQQRAGLNVIQSATFGALSEGERKFALASAIPMNLEGPALREWLVEKERVNEKVAALMEEAAIYLGEGGTLSGWAKMQQERRKAGTPQAPAPANTQPATGGGWGVRRLP